MNFYILTLFPQMIKDGLNTSIIGRAAEKKLLKVFPIDIRDYTLDKHKKVDDYPYGGGAGMLMQAQPIFDAYEAIQKEMMDSNVEIVYNNKQIQRKKTRVIYLTPQGEVFHQNMAKELAEEEDLILLCGHYEGIDERVLEEIVTDYISIGDFVLTGGELPAMVLVDAIARLVPGVLSNDASAATESHSDYLLEYPQYTRPEEWRGKKVPEVLLSGHHSNIARWRLEQAKLRTEERREDMYQKYLSETINEK